MIFEIYVSDKNQQDSYDDTNQYCYRGKVNGIVNCQGTGQYLIFKLVEIPALITPEFGFTELRIYDMPDLASNATITYKDVTTWEGSFANLANPAANLLGSSNGGNECVTGTVPSNLAVFEI